MILTSARATLLAAACSLAACSGREPQPKPPRPVVALGGLPLAGTDADAKARGFTECVPDQTSETLRCKYSKSLQLDEFRPDYAEVTLNISGGSAAPSASYSGVRFYFDPKAPGSPCEKQAKPRAKHKQGVWDDVDGTPGPCDNRLHDLISSLKNKGWIADSRGSALYRPGELYYIQPSDSALYGSAPHIIISPMDDDADAAAANAFRSAEQLSSEKAKAAALVEKMRSAK